MSVEGSRLSWSGRDRGKVACRARARAPVLRKNTGKNYITEWRGQIEGQRGSIRQRHFFVSRIVQYVASCPCSGDAGRPCYK